MRRFDWRLVWGLLAVILAAAVYVEVPSWGTIPRTEPDLRGNECRVLVKTGLWLPCHRVGPGNYPEDWALRGREV